MEFKAGDKIYLKKPCGSIAQGEIGTLKRLKNGPLRAIFRSCHIVPFCNEGCVMCGGSANWILLEAVDDRYMDGAPEAKQTYTVDEFFKNEEDLAIHCKTMEEAKRLCKMFDEAGYTWSNGKSYAEEDSWLGLGLSVCYWNDNRRSDYKYAQDVNATILTPDQIEGFEEKGTTWGPRKGIRMHDAWERQYEILQEQYENYLDAMKQEAREHLHNQTQNNLTQNNMSLVQKFKAAIKSEPAKTFAKAGVIDECDNLTSQGKELFIHWLLEQHGDEFKKQVVDEIVKEQDKKSK